MAADVAAPSASDIQWVVVSDYRIGQRIFHVGAFKLFPLISTDNHKFNWFICYLAMKEAIYQFGLH